MLANTQDALRQSEERYKEEVYKKFDELRKAAYHSAIAHKQIVEAGSYEDQEAFMLHADLAEANKNRHETEFLIQKLYKKPYFSHVEVEENEENERDHYFLSDCETLESVIFIGNNGYLVPFKQDPKRPISAALFHCYQAKKGETVYYKRGWESFSLVPKFICDDEIDNRHLINAIQLFPDSGAAQITADELLEEKLRENRNNPVLRNIIATLQRMQFEIIEADIAESFVVQGCAGSGKSQCVLHRLFFLRDTLSQSGWEHVLFITPTQLFRNYSAELIRRYQLASIENCSIAELYRSLLNAYDERFKNRQYRFELTEEYLPDEYLHAVYDATVIATIDSEIEQAIRKYVQAGCTMVGINMPATITFIQVEKIIRLLDREIQEFDARESILQLNKEYTKKRQQYEAMQKQQEALERRRKKAQEDYNKIIEEEKDLYRMVASAREAQEERKEWKRQREEKCTNALNELYEIKDQWDNGKDVQAPSRYARRLFTVQDMYFGEQHRADEEYSRFLDEYCDQMNEEIQKLTNLMDIEKAVDINKKRKDDIQKRIDHLNRQEEEITSTVEEYANWLRENSNLGENGAQGRVLRRSELERTRFFLSRIESTVFEREVWNALAPLKEKYNIRTIQVDQVRGGHRKETRILYKSDLLFYLKIYNALYPKAKLPEYQLICVDEGQDLHEADYNFLHRLYPKAVFNIFGDTNQVLHDSCGIRDWRRETGIKNIYHLNRNYRNTAAIVDFCNQLFGSNMEYVGSVKQDQKPHIITGPEQLRNVLEKDGITLIVKNRKILEKISAQTGKHIDEFEYLDTRAEKHVGIKIPCYSIYAAKGLEFTNVVACVTGMTTNQKVVACTRAMEELYYYE